MSGIDLVKVMGSDASGKVQETDEIGGSDRVKTGVVMATATEQKARPDAAEMKRLRQKARRKQGEAQKALEELMKPIEEWDEEELAHGRPRDAGGQFRGQKPKWISSQIHEEALRRFKDLSQADLRGLVPVALERIRWAITCEDTDDDGRRIVPISTSVDAAKWAVEHLLGKPTQRIEGEISVKLQALLGMAMVNPSGKEAIEVAVREIAATDDDD